MTPANGTSPADKAGVEMDTGILFMDLVDSSIFASVLGIREYAAHLDSFHRICLRHCEHFFEGFLEGQYKEGPDYSARIIGDELLVFVHTGQPRNDVYMLTCLAATLKAAWLAAPLNRERISRKQATSQISGGIHFGTVWAVPEGTGFDFSGYAINMAKRIEGHSRDGSRYRILLSDHAFKQVHFQQRNLVFGHCLEFDSKGLLGKTAAFELVSTFMNPGPRIAPEIAEDVRRLLEALLRRTTQDPWMHDFHQVWHETVEGRITDEAMELCRSVLLHEPGDPISLYYLAQGLRERKDGATAKIILRELISIWPRFGDGHLELARLLHALGETNAATDSLRVARLFGIDDPFP